MDGSMFDDFFKGLPWFCGAVILIAVGVGFLIGRC